MIEECRHSFWYIDYGEGGCNCWPLTKCDKCGEDFIVYEKDKDTRHCYRLLRGHEAEIYDFDTGALVIS